MGLSLDRGAVNVPSGSYKQIEVRCPFYKFDDGKRRITCEGIIDDSSLALIYHNKRDYGVQMDNYCCKHYIMCEIYRMLMNKYDEEE